VRRITMNNRKKIQGVVVRTKADKTIAVQVDPYKKHPIYSKRVQDSHRYYAHDEKNEAKLGDIVTIEESRPLSATKRFRLVSIDKRAIESVKVAEESYVEEVLHEDESEEASEKHESVKELENEKKEVAASTKAEKEGN
jgi:small subunit ribosomal protein S17